MRIAALARANSTKWKRTAVIAAIVLAGVASLSVLPASAKNRNGALSEQPSSALHFKASASFASDPVKYSALAASYNLYIASDEADVLLHGETNPASELGRGKLIVVSAYAHLLRMRFVNSNLPTSVGPLDLGKQSRSYYTAVAYRGMYPGTDVVLRGDQQHIGFQLNLSPGADSGHVVLELAGATGIGLNKDGDAIVHVGAASLMLARPIVTSNLNGAPQRLAGAYQIEGPNRLRFIISNATEGEKLLTD